MRIGILTLPLGHNYGGILQAWALKTVLEREGHQVWNLIHKGKISLLAKIKQCGRRIISKYIKHRPGVEIFRSEKNTRIKNTLPFIKKHFRYLDINDSLPYKVDAIVVGSDQVWRREYAGSHLEDYYLRFAERTNIPKISYAASFGVDYYEYSESERLMASRLINKFAAVSVRESSGIDLCKNMLGIKDAVQMPDPTLLLEKEDYLSLIPGMIPIEVTTSLFRYVLDPSKESKLAIEYIEKELGVQSFTVHSRIDDWNAPLNERIQPPLENWIHAFKTCEFVITDSFHGCVFSIIFNKNFIVVGNKKRGLARIESLLEQFGLSHRLLDVDSVDDKTIDSIAPIDWDSVNTKRQKLKQTGTNFLKSHLN